MNVTGEAFLVKHGPFIQCHQQLQEMPCHRMRHPNTHAVTHFRQSQCRFFYLGRRDLETADIDYIVRTTLQV